jgi:Protein of unknown function (DUF2726)
LLIVIVILILAAVIGIAAAKNRRRGSGSIGLTYQSASTLFSAAERSFLGVLDRAVGSEHRVFGKVRVADVAVIKTGLGNSARQGALNRIAAKHCDFVVCRADDLSVVCAVEHNDKSHASQRSQARDEFLARVCDAISFRCSQSKPSAHILRRNCRRSFSQPLHHRLAWFPKPSRAHSKVRND